ncbi:DUF3997 domain-containing protein [Microbacteriaceae bacterium 4G12]
MLGSLSKWMIPFTILLLVGCTQQTHKSLYDIGEDYQVISSFGQNIEILPKQDAINASQLIPPKVTEAAWNHDYILAKQLELVDDPTNPGSQIPNPKKENYWIIDIKNNQRFGPYTKKQFEAQKKEFRISSSLQLKSISDTNTSNH